MGSPSKAPVPIFVVALILGGCVLPPLATPTPIPTASPTPSASLTPTPTGTPVPTTSPTPDFGAVPDFSAGDVIVTAIDGLRVRQSPGLSGNVVTGLLPLGVELQVVMGPIPTAELGWYLVADADPGDPEFDEGWIATGFEPDAWLASAGRTVEDSAYLASYAHTGDAEHGPVEIGSGDHAIRWVASDVVGRGCRFAVSLATGGDDPVPAIRSTVGEGDLVPGTLQPGQFDALGVRGATFVTVASDCAWTLAIERVPEPEPSEAP